MRVTTRPPVILVYSNCKVISMFVDVLSAIIIMRTHHTLSTLVHNFLCVCECVLNTWHQIKIKFENLVFNKDRKIKFPQNLTSYF